MSPGNFYIRVTGGVQSVQLRIDDESPTPQPLATEIEKKIDSVIINGSDLYRLSNAHRLRTSVLTLVSGVHEDDLDLNGFGEAYADIQKGCPGEPVAKSAETVTNPASIVAANGCSERAKAKMKIKGLSEDQINDICVK